MRPEGASRGWGRAEQQRGELQKSERQVGGLHWVGGPGGLGEPGLGRQGKTAQLRRSPGPPYLCLRVRSLGQACRKHGVRAEGEEPGVRKEGTPGTKERGRSLPQSGRAADGGNCDHTQTRTHARTPDASR